MAKSDVLSQEARLRDPRDPAIVGKATGTDPQPTHRIAGPLPAAGAGGSSISHPGLPSELAGEPAVATRGAATRFRAAEATLHAANANVASQSPINCRSSLSPGPRHRAWGFTNLFTPATAIWSIAGGITQTLFDGGTLLHKKRAAVEAFNQAAAQYRSTVIKAFQNVADALRALQADAAALRAQAVAEQTAGASLNLARSQFRLARSPRDPGGRPAHLSASPDQSGSGAGQPLRGHRRVVPGAWRRLVASQRRGPMQASPTVPISTTASTDGAGHHDQTHDHHADPAVAVLGGVFGFQVFKANIIKHVMASLANPPQTVSTVTAAISNGSRGSAVGTLRAVNGAELSLQLAGIVSEIGLQVRRRRAGRPGAAAAAQRRRRCQVAVTAGHGRACADHL